MFFFLTGFWYVYPLITVDQLFCSIVGVVVVPLTKELQDVFEIIFVRPPFSMGIFFKGFFFKLGKKTKWWKTWICVHKLNWCSLKLTSTRMGPALPSAAMGTPRPTSTSLACCPGSPRRLLLPCRPAQWPNCALALQMRLGSEAEISPLFESLTRDIPGIGAGDISPLFQVK